MKGFVNKEKLPLDLEGEGGNWNVRRSNPAPKWSWIVVMTPSSRAMSLKVSSLWIKRKEQPVVQH